MKRVLTILSFFILCLACKPQSQVIVYQSFAIQTDLDENHIPELLKWKYFNYETRSAINLTIQKENEIESLDNSHKQNLTFSVLEFKLKREETNEEIVNIKNMKNFNLNRISPAWKNLIYLSQVKNKSKEKTNSSRLKLRFVQVFDTFEVLGNRHYTVSLFENTLGEKFWWDPEVGVVKYTSSHDHWELFTNNFVT